MRVSIIALLAISLLACGTTRTQAATSTLQPDSCGAAAMQGFVGKPKAKLPVNLPKGARVLCDTCAATMDYSPARLNIIYDSKTGIVTKIRCG